MTRFAFRVNANKDIGMGHLMRCLYLAEQWPAPSLFCINDNTAMREKVKERGHRCHILSSVTDQDFEVMVKALATYPKPFHTAQPSGASELKELKELLRSEEISVLITDLLTPSTEYLHALKETGVRLVSIDELGQACFPSDLLFNCNAVSSSRNYKTENGTKVFMGQQYALLSCEFLKIEEKNVQREVRKILVTCGGTDMRGLSLKILPALKPFLGKMEILFVQGIDFKFQNELGVLLKTMEGITVFKNVKNMCALMQSADIAIAAGGTTMYELAALGVPAIIVGQYPHQEEFAAELAKQSALVNLGVGEKVESEQLESAVTDLLPFNRRKEMSAAAREAIDGRGAMRVAQIIQEIAA